RARTSRHDPHIEVTEQDSFFAAVCDGPESTRRPRLEIRDGHFTTQNKCRKPRRHAQHKQDGANRLKKTRNTTLRKQVRNRPRPGKPKQFFRPVLKEKQRRRYAHSENHIRCAMLHSPDVSGIDHHTPSAVSSAVLPTKCTLSESCRASRRPGPVG